MKLRPTTDDCNYVFYVEFYSSALKQKKRSQCNDDDGAKRQSCERINIINAFWFDEFLWCCSIKRTSFICVACLWAPPNERVRIILYKNVKYMLPHFRSCSGNGTYSCASTVWVTRAMFRRITARPSADSKC